MEVLRKLLLLLPLLLHRSRKKRLHQRLHLCLLPHQLLASLHLPFQQRLSKRLCRLLLRQLLHLQQTTCRNNLVA